jgi:putative heme iron utilization protein
VGIDTDGADLRRGEDVIRLPFPAPVMSGGALRKVLADLGAQTKS